MFWLIRELNNGTPWCVKCHQGSFGIHLQAYGRFFISRLWQIHVFGEGNTRTTAFFFIKYLRMLGFDAENDLFADNSWYFGIALVRANYNNIKD